MTQMANAIIGAFVPCVLVVPLVLAIEDRSEIIVGRAWRVSVGDIQPV
jgi:hypothetical protein